MWIRRGGVLKNVSELKFKLDYAQRGYEPVVPDKPEPVVAPEPEKAPEPVAESKPGPEDEPDLFVCPECGKEYKTARGLEDHMKAKHESGETSE